MPAASKKLNTSKKTTRPVAELVRFRTSPNSDEFGYGEVSLRDQSRKNRGV
jgi:hypothetical protein